MDTPMDRRWLYYLSASRHAEDGIRMTSELLLTIDTCTAPTRPGLIQTIAAQCRQLYVLHRFQLGRIFAGNIADFQYFNDHVNEFTRQYETDTWDTVAIMFVQPALSVLGILGDLSMLITIQCGRLRDSPYIYLKCIAFGDLVLLLLVMSLFVAQCATCQFSIRTVYYLDLYFWFVYMTITNLMRGWLVLLTLFMTIERLIYVRWPMKTRRLCTRERAKRVCLVLFAVACASQLMRPWQFYVRIGEQEFLETKTSVRVAGDFHCIANINETTSDNRFICHNEGSSFRAQGDPTHSDCKVPGGSRLDVAPQSTECLHQLCILPEFPRNLNFGLHERIDDSWVVLEASHLNVTIKVLTNEHLSLPADNIYGSSLFINQTCNFVLAPMSLNGTVAELNDFFLEPYKEPVQCVVARAHTGSGWRGQVLTVYLEIWEGIFITCTGVLTIVNVLIVFVVHRANRKAREEVLPHLERDAKSKRQAEENRLTMSLLVLSCVKILADLMFISCETLFAGLFYTEVSPPSFRLKIHRIIAAQIHVFEYSSYFYLLAFINRKFKREFLHQVVYGKLLMKRIPESVLKMFSTSMRTDPKASRKDALEMTSSPTGGNEKQESNGDRDYDSGETIRRELLE